MSRRLRRQAQRRMRRQKVFAYILLHLSLLAVMIFGFGQMSQIAARVFPTALGDLIFAPGAILLQYMGNKLISQLLAPAKD